MQNPIVSVCCITYNHEKFISQALDGFLMQKTDFNFEVIIHDDASTDNTAMILKEYEENYSNLFRCVYQTENQFKKQNTLTKILFPMTKGKYIALCEGLNMHDWLNCLVKDAINKD
jgi:glycosyltransferase involved in cell wall biosynthesis